MTEETTRFWIKVRKSDGCWEWTGCLRGAHRYGGFGIHRDGKWKMVAAHRYSWELVFGSGAIPAGLQICHRCDNPKCVRPEHLFLGTPRDNVRDCMRKGRFSPPPLCVRARLTVDAVRSIRDASASGISRHELARRFAVHRSVIQDVVNRVSWKEVA